MLTTFTPIISAAAIIAEIDDTPPPMPLPVNLVSSDGTTASGISYFFGGSYPNYVKYYYRLQVAGASDCQKLPNDTIVTTFTGSAIFDPRAAIRTLCDRRGRSGKSQ